MWFGKIKRDGIARGVFTRVSNLKRKLMRYIRHYNEPAKHVKWKYFDPSRMITSESIIQSASASPADNCGFWDRASSKVKTAERTSRAATK